LAALIAVERTLGPLPAEYREFLLKADSWPCFYQWVDLFGTKDLLGPKSVAASRLAETLRRAGVAVDRSLLPIAMTRGETSDHLGSDLFLIGTRAEALGTVSWFGGEELVEVFSNFAQWFASMTAYSQQEVERLLRERRPALGERGG
jgi:hypothetical protein